MPTRRHAFVCLHAGTYVLARHVRFVSQQKSPSCVVRDVSLGQSQPVCFSNSGCAVIFVRQLLLRIFPLFCSWHWRANVTAFRVGCWKAANASQIREQRLILWFVGGCIWLMAPKESVNGLACAKAKRWDAPSCLAISGGWVSGSSYLYVGFLFHASFFSLTSSLISLKIKLHHRS